jgi:hypothetical protein
MARSWIPNKITRRPTTPCEHILVNIVCDLIDPDAWDHELVKNLFWEDDVMVILAIPLKEVQGGELELNLSSLEPLQNFGAPALASATFHSSPQPRHGSGGPFSFPKHFSSTAGSSSESLARATSSPPFGSGSATLEVGARS